MQNLISTQNTGVITLKEITDLIDVRHDKAKLKVDELAKEPSFSEVSKMDTFNLNNVKVETFDEYNMQLIKNLPSIPDSRVKRF